MYVMVVNVQSKTQNSNGQKGSQKWIQFFKIKLICSQVWIKTLITIKWVWIKFGCHQMAMNEYGH
jgi:hypothetical protein